MDNTYMNENAFLKRIRLAFHSISIYRKVLEDKILTKYYNLISYISNDKIDIYEAINLYNDFFFSLISADKVSLKDYIIERVIFDENQFTDLKAEENDRNKENIILGAAKNDLLNLQLIAHIKADDIKECLKSKFEGTGLESAAIDNLPIWVVDTERAEGIFFNNEAAGFIFNKLYDSNNWCDCISDLRLFHTSNGSGIFAKYRALIWQNYGQGSLKGIESPDLISLDSLSGYERERSRVIQNTEQFLKGYTANNVLLYGDRGTGKSSTVKAILNEYYEQGLRLVEVAKSNLMDFPLIINSIKNKPNKFILFVDDLAFEDKEESYTALKATLEGSMECKPSNIIIYATSNRRHLIKEYFHDRAGLEASAEVHASDSQQEKLSLADRFGISIVFSSPDQKEYFEIVDAIAEQKNLIIDKEFLHSEAKKWELKYNGRSARTAKQFVDWMEAYLSMKEDK